ncbi:twin-arginine translocation pathway signal [Beutenbergia cavernae DSM 12333]|uniref:Twin-arginine translocation pathway signal n=1 Tax=Beutenbergia cavernae (strain ATCC BAA-8 / DSM 12333 / CCUG 43141 / JCM 11478 / NBRC 16432 / NCIMB 13614 / HKI 0122) TaxID=471853 RepID=C5C2C0_BEUC1|nr:ferritin-like domain-containing protein [Beutenbergia cavernae]ACQ81745.1 twin-arginine translocation pathway signal [Beutenbergia cavernae DSM 12333]
MHDTHEPPTADPGRAARARRSSKLFGGAPVMQFRTEASRRTFLTGAALIGVGGTFVAATRNDPRAFALSEGDLEILNYALTLEYLEAEFYTQGISGGVLVDRELELVTPIREHEQTHVTGITQLITDLGGTPVESPVFMFPDGTFTDRTMFLEAASMFEELGVDAYHGQVALIEDAEILATAASIAGTESRHAAVVADLLGGDPFPAPFENNLPMEDVLEAAGQFIEG